MVYERYGVGIDCILRRYRHICRYVVKGLVPAREGVALARRVCGSCRGFAVVDGLRVEHCAVMVYERYGVGIDCILSRYRHICRYVVKGLVPACEGIAIARRVCRSCRGSSFKYALRAENGAVPILERYGVICLNRSR